MMSRDDAFGKTVFVDLLLNMLLFFMFLTVNSMNAEALKKQKDDALATEGLFAVVASWPDDSADDVDLYVRDPNGTIAYFSARDVGLMHLEHDDQGEQSDMAAGGQVKVRKNQERVVIRGVVPGEYVVHLHMYNKRDAVPRPVTVSLVRLRGDDADLKSVERVLAARQEATAFRFTLALDESVSDINELPFKKMVGDQPGGLQ